LLEARLLPAVWVHGPGAAARAALFILPST
jgi:hypothetical protein